MTTNRYSTILFDLDGTLTSSLPSWVEAYRHAFNQCNVDNITDEAIIHHCFYKSTEEIIGRVAAEFDIQTTAAEFRDRVQEGLRKSYGKAGLFDGVLDVLEYCTRQNIKVGLVTSAPRTIADKILKDLKIDQNFKAMVTADDVTNLKPHPESVHLALKQLCADPKDCLFIGDSSSDILAGHSANVETALFFTEGHKLFHDLEDLLKTKPHYIFGSYQEIAAHLVAQAAKL